MAHIQLCIQMCWELVAKTTHYSKEHWLWFTSHPLEYDSSEVARPLRCSKIWKTRNGKCLRQAQNATAKIPTHAQQFNYSMECHILCTTPWLSLTHTQCVNGLMVILSGATAFWLMFWQMWEQHECMGPSVTQISLDHHTHIVEKQLSLPLDHIFCPLIIVHPNEGEQMGGCPWLLIKTNAFHFWTGDHGVTVKWVLNVLRWMCYLLSMLLWETWEIFFSENWFVFVAVVVPLEIPVCIITGKQHTIVPQGPIVYQLNIMGTKDVTVPLKLQHIKCSGI